MHILLTNDDGIDAPGLAALHMALEGLADLSVVAPSGPRSATSHGVTFHRPMAVHRHEAVEASPSAVAGYAVDGKPADCVRLGLAKLLSSPVDLVISGINAGANIGVNVLYSGTVAAAREAAIYGIPAVAISLYLSRAHETRWDLAAACARNVLQAVLAGPLTSGSLVNINLPVQRHDAEPRGVRVCRMSPSALINAYRRVDLHAGHAYEIPDTLAFEGDAPRDDWKALREGYVTVTPMRVDQTDDQALAAWMGHLHV